MINQTARGARRRREGGWDAPRREALERTHDRSIVLLGCRVDAAAASARVAPARALRADGPPSQTQCVVVHTKKDDGGGGGRWWSLEPFEITREFPTGGAAANSSHLAVRLKHADEGEDLELANERDVVPLLLRRAARDVALGRRRRSGTTSSVRSSRARRHN